MLTQVDNSLEHESGVFCLAGQCYQGQTFPPLPQPHIITLFDNSTDDMAVSMRSNFKDYFYYAIANVNSDNLKASNCPSTCNQLSKFCCAIVTAFEPMSATTTID
jgi:hypothetical protein